MLIYTGLKVVLLFPTFPTFLSCSYFFLKYSYYSYFLNETKIKNVYVSLLQKKTCYKIEGLMAYTDVHNIDKVLTETLEK